MSPNLEKCEALALELPPEDRATLVARLLASLDEVDDAELERLWVEEAERRYEAYKHGRVQSRAAADVLRDARAELG